jgi:predicted lysophospholipase L1 biosynthesis ABC-type transport system permease subunit
MSQDPARAANIKIGDEVTLFILGREIVAKVAVIRRADFGSFGARFPLVLTPNVGPYRLFAGIWTGRSYLRRGGGALGYAAAWPVVVRVFEAKWSVDWGGVFTLLAIASALRSE